MFVDICNTIPLSMDEETDLKLKTKNIQELTYDEKGDIVLNL